VKFYNTFKSNDYLFFLLEFIDGINLREYLNNKKKENLRNLYEVSFFGAILFNVLNYLQNKRILHRDLKPENLMIGKNGYLKVIDFGIAKDLNNNDNKNKHFSIVGTTHYLAPEIIEGKNYSFGIDYWSVGIILYEIFYGNTPFGSSTGDVNKIYKEILENKPFLTSDPKNKILNNLINSLLSKKPSSRISSFQDIKNHEFFKDFDFEKLLNFNCVAPYTPDEFINKNEDEFLKNEFTPLVNFIKNCIYQNSTEIDENMWKQHLDDCFINY
jgi:cGMP-dependent protein kinase